MVRHRASSESIELDSQAAMCLRDIEKCLLSAGTLLHSLLKEAVSTATSIEARTRSNAVFTPILKGDPGTSMSEHSEMANKHGTMVHETLTYESQAVENVPMFETCAIESVDDGSKRKELPSISMSSSDESSQPKYYTYTETSEVIREIGQISIQDQKTERKDEVLQEKEVVPSAFKHTVDEPSLKSSTKKPLSPIGRDWIMDFGLQLSKERDALLGEPKILSLGETICHRAARCGDLEVLELCLMRGFDIDAQDHYKNSPSWIALSHQRSEVLNHLLENGADADQTNKLGWTLLHQAAAEGHVTMLDIIIHHTKNINVKNTHGETPIHLATSHGRSGCVKLLIKAGANINEVDKQLRTPLHYAAMFDKDEIIPILCENGADVDAKDYMKLSPIHHAKKSIITTLLIQWRADINITEKELRTPIHYAALHGQHLITKVLLEAGAEFNQVDDKLKTPLHYACEYNHQEVVKVLCDAGADLHVRDHYSKTPLLYVSNINIATMLLTRGADINTRDKYEGTCTQYAVMSGREKMVQLLIENGADINSPDNNMNTPLHHAITHNRSDIALLLVQSDVEIKARNNLKKTPIICCGETGSRVICHALINKGAVLEDQDSYGNTALSYCAMNGHTDLCKLLIDSGANLNTQNSQKDTPLHLATTHNRREIVRLLVEAKADVDINNHIQNTPLMSAVRANHHNIAEYLLQNGADINAEDRRQWSSTRHALFSNNFVILNMLVKDSNNNLNDVDSDGFTLLHFAIYHSHIKPAAASTLIKAGIDLNMRNAKGATPLYYTAWKNRAEIAKEILETGKVDDVDDKNYSGETPLHTAIIDGHKEMISLLIQYGAVLEKTNGSGMTGWDLAKKHGMEDYLLALQKK